jgi:hypothetical protein
MNYLNNKLPKLPVTKRPLGPSKSSKLSKNEMARRSIARQEEKQRKGNEEKALIDTRRVNERLAIRRAKIEKRDAEIEKENQADPVRAAEKAAIRARQARMDAGIARILREMEAADRLRRGQTPQPVSIVTAGSERLIRGQSTQPVITRPPVTPLKAAENKNPNQLQVVTGPANPVITSASYPDQCIICQEPVVKGCRVNCKKNATENLKDQGHIFHCDCINEWRNTRATNTFYDKGWQNGCPLCRVPIDSMYYITIPEGFKTEFGKRRRINKGTKMSLVSIKKLIKLVKKL